MLKNYRYVFRYLIDPSYEADSRIEELSRFCQEAHVEEVMLMMFAEELNAGHPTPEDFDSWIALAQCVRKTLAGIGVEMSLNPWTTTHHAGRGRPLSPDQKFRRMVGETGAVESVAACPLCEDWQAYLSDTFSRLASEIKPIAIWIEDDWRLHNHSPELGWGGCFCEEHLRRFSLLVNESVSRELLLEKLLFAGAPHPWRQVWIDLNRETLSAPLRRLSSVIRHAQPNVRIGLMSSVAEEHSIEGRNWGEFQEILEDENGFLTRPHMPPYCQRNSLFVAPASARQTIANLRRPLSLFPELESAPRNGVYSKSGAYTRMQMLHAALMGSNGTTLNHFDLMGTGLALDRSFGGTLAKSKAQLNELAKLELNDEFAHGVKVLFSPDIARHHRLSSPASSISSLGAPAALWSNVFYPLGIAHSFTKSTRHEESVVAVSGQTPWAFSDREIETLLEGAVLLDAAAAEILVQRGFGSLIGVESARWRDLNEAAFSYEEISEPDSAVYGVANPRLTAQLCTQTLLELSCLDSCHVISTINSPKHQVLWSGMTIFANELGGRVACISYALEMDLMHWSLAAFCNPYRRRFMSRLLFDLSPSATLADVDNHPMHVYRSPTNSGTLLSALNATDDPVSHIVWNLPKGQFRDDNWHALNGTGAWHPITPVVMEMAAFDQYDFDLSTEPLKGGFLHYAER